MYMYGVKKILLTLLFLFPSHLFAYPPQSELFGLSESMTHIWVTFKDGVTGTGSGIVVKKNHVATNCHVLADSRGVNAVKYFKSYVPIAIYADWENDLCILKFDDFLYLSNCKSFLESFLLFLTLGAIRVLSTPGELQI